MCSSDLERREDIPRIGQTAQELQGIGRELRTGQSVGYRLTVGKMTCQQGNIFATFAQGRQFHCYQIDTIEEVFTKSTFAYHFAQYIRHDDARVTEGAALAGMTLDEIERQTILQALDRYKGNLSQVATALGISRAALYRRLEKYNITM